MPVKQTPNGAGRSGRQHVALAGVSHQPREDQFFTSNYFFTSTEGPASIKLEVLYPNPALDGTGAGRQYR